MSKWFVTYTTYITSSVIYNEICNDSPLVGVDISSWSTSGCMFMWRLARPITQSMPNSWQTLGYVWDQKVLSAIWPRMRSILPLEMPWCQDCDITYHINILKSFNSITLHWCQKCDTAWNPGQFYHSTLVSEVWYSLKSRSILPLYIGVRSVIQPEIQVNFTTLHWCQKCDTAWNPGQFY